MLGVEGGSTEGFLAGFSFETLLAPFDQETFLRDHWDQTPLVLQRALPDFYDGLTSLPQIDAMLSAGAFHASYTDAASGQGRTHVIDSTTPERPATDALLARVSMGATLILDDADVALPGLGRMCRLLMVETGHPWHCNLYATPLGGQGFEAHVETTGVFILQIAGQKDWTFGRAQISRPVAGEPSQPAPDDWQQDADSVRLSAGDMLYLPRGVSHAATTGSDAASVHVTLTVLEYSWAQVARITGIWDAEMPRPKPASRYRGLLPIGFHRSDGDLAEALQSHFPDGSQMSIEPLFEHQIRQFKPDLSGRLDTALNPVQLNEDSRFLPRKDVLWRILPKHHTCHLICGSIRLAFPTHATGFVSTLMQSGGTLDQLEVDLSTQDKLAIAHCLLQHNLIRLRNGGS